VPAALAPSELQSVLVVINQFIETPYDLNGKKASELLSKPRRRRRHRLSSPENDLPSDEDEPQKKKREKKKKEKEQYKSATFIEDSDAEYGDIEAFLEKEKAQREKTARAAESGGIGNMKSTGTKRRRKKTDTGGGKKRKGNDESLLVSTRRQEAGSDTGQSENTDVDAFGSRRSSAAASTSPPAERPRPRPRLIPRTSAPSVMSNGSPPPDILDGTTDVDVGAGKLVTTANDGDLSPQKLTGLGTAGRRRQSRLVISDDEE